MARATTCSAPYLFRRGGVWWWRRRLPTPASANAALTPGMLGSRAADRAGRPTLALSLRTACRIEARRRGARLAACFEDAVAAGRALMNGAPESETSFASGLLALLRENVALEVARQAASHEALARQTELSLALASRLGAPAPTQIVAPSKPVHGGSIDDPEFEAALLALADREGWWHDDADEVLEQFDWMLVGLMTVQAEYVRYCARKGLDPATALPSIARLAETLHGTAAATGALAPSAQTDGAARPEAKGDGRLRAEARDPALDAAPQSPRPAPGAATRRRSNLLVSEIFERFLDMKAKGYEIDPAQETPSPASGAKFCQTSRPNILSTMRLIIDIIGDKPLDTISPEEWRAFIATLPRMPNSHGKSSREKRSCLEIADDLDREDALNIARERARLQALRMPPQEIDATVASLRAERLATNTCLRHMRDAARVIDYALHHRLVGSNELRPLIWRKKEIARRLRAETAARRRPWHDEIYKLFRTPVFQGALDEPGDPLLWAPLLGELAGLRAEEALQLRIEDFRSDGGIAYLSVVARDESQSTKSEESRRNVPLHPHLIDLGLLELVALRRSQNFRTLFPHQTRGATKGRLSENFSKRFTHYRKQHGVYHAELDFHSFRTGFNQRLQGKGVSMALRQELMGHERSELIQQHYDAKSSPIETLKQCVDRIDLDVSMIRSPFPKASAESGAPTLRLVKPGHS